MKTSQEKINAFNKVCLTIESCNDKKQLRAIDKMIDNYCLMFNELSRINTLIDLFYKKMVQLKK